MFTGAMVAMYVSYLLVLAYVPGIADSPARALGDRGGVVGVHAIFLLAPPMSLTDVFNYINYGRMEVASSEPVHHISDPSPTA